MARFRSIESSNGHPPGPVDSWLGETLVHAEDIRRPLGITHDYSVDAAIRLADFYTALQPAHRVEEARRGSDPPRATDAEWSSGSGPEVTGPAMAIVMTMTGRTVALDELAGDGLETLRARM